MVNQGAQQPALYTLAIAGALISIIPLIALFLSLQRYWRIDLISGGLKG
jgi:multiple sugar transport system permease protein